MNYTDTEIKNIISRYEKTKEYNKTYYHKKYRDDMEFRENRRERAKEYYVANPDKKKEYYEKTKERQNTLNNWRYAVSVGKEDRFKKKYSLLYDKYIKPKYDNLPS
jgi:short subunit dehydrogenase-like uncharacterized protein